MEQSMIAAVSGIEANQTYLDVIGNNVANANTTGYKSQQVGFTDLLNEQIAGAAAPLPGGAGAGVNPLAIGSGVRVGSVTDKLTQGALMQTNQPTDVAIQGGGYFVVSQNGTTSYSRAGHFMLDANGDLATPSGGLIQGWQADSAGNITTGATTTAIQIPTAAQVTANGNLESFTIGPDGVITGTFSKNTAPVAIGQIALASFANPGGLDGIGNTMYLPTGNSGVATLSGPGTGGAGTLVGGSLETSNVNLAADLTDLIVAQEAYQANTKVVSTSSTVLTSLTQMV